MRVVASSVGRFPFDLARQLNKANALERVFTGYPSWKIDADLRSHTTSFPWIVTPQMALNRYGYQRLADRLSLPAANTLDKWVAAHLPECSLFVGYSQSGLFTIRVAKRRGIKTVCERGSAHIVTQNEILVEEYRRHKVPFPGIAPWAIEKELREYAEADLIKVPSTFSYRTFVEQGVSTDKLVNISLGVDLSLFHPLPKEDKTFRVLFVGMVSLRKGIPYLLEAVSTLNLPDMETVITGAMQDEIKPTLSRYNGSYRFTDVIPRDKLSWHYSQASVLVLPSVEDGFGLVMAQAMACGIPVIATTNTGAADLFTDGVEGFILPIRSPEAIREKLLYLYENPDIREQMGQAALRRVQSIGGWEEHGRQSIQAFQALLARPQYLSEPDAPDLTWRSSASPEKNNQARQ